MCRRTPAERLKRPAARSTPAERKRGWTRGASRVVIDGLVVSDRDTRRLRATPDGAGRRERAAGTRTGEAGTEDEGRGTARAGERARTTATSGTAGRQKDQRDEQQNAPHDEKENDETTREQEQDHNKTLRPIPQAGNTGGEIFGRDHRGQIFFPPALAGQRIGGACYGLARLCVSSVISFRCLGCFAAFAGWRVVAGVFGGVVVSRSVGEWTVDVSWLRTALIRRGNGDDTSTLTTETTVVPQRRVTGASGHRGERRECVNGAFYF